MLEQVLQELRSRHSRPIEAALRYIHDHYAQPISMAEVAGQLYRSPEHFSRQFKEEVGENFSSYLTATAWTGPRSCSSPLICPCPGWRC